MLIRGQVNQMQNFALPLFTALSRLAPALQTVTDKARVNLAVWTSLLPAQ
jgi:hypothetical protein